MATSIQTSNKPTILITGANGLLGQKLISQLMERGKFEVIGTGRGACRLDRAGFTYWSIDLTQPEEVSRVIAELAPDTIIHTAAMTHVDECEQNQQACLEINVKATEYLVRAAEKLQSHFIYVSTDFIYSGDRGPMTKKRTRTP